MGAMSLTCYNIVSNFKCIYPDKESMKKIGTIMMNALWMSLVF